MKHHARKALNRRRSPDLYWRRYRPPFTPMRGAEEPLSKAKRARLVASLAVLGAAYGMNPAPPFSSDPYQELSRLSRPKASPTIRYLTA